MVVGVSRRTMTLVSFALVLVALASAADLLLLTAWGSRAPAWSHFWCSPSALHAAARHGGPVGGLVAALIGFFGALLPHWPHILPILLALATLVYLRRADARYHAHECHARG
jgi:hypothetical protein